MTDRLSALLVGLLAALLLMPSVSLAQPLTGQKAPVFTLKDLAGRQVDLAAMKAKPLTILYFFDVGSRPSQEGLLSLNDLAKLHQGELEVLAVTVSPAEKVSRFVSETGLGFPILIDSGAASSLYQARQVLPVVCIIGPGLKVLDYFQGGGKGTEAMLERLAERELQRKKTRLAKAVSHEVTRKNPQNVKAKAVKGHAALKEGNLKEAEEVFTELAGKGGQGEVLGKEGLAAVQTKRGHFDKALQLIREVELKAPDRSYVHVLKGNILSAQNKKAEAGGAYRTAVAKKIAEPYQEGARYNQLGRHYGSGGEHEKARELFRKAETVDPYYVEGTTNKGLSYEKDGKLDQALKAYREALAIDNADLYAQLLAKRAKEKLDLQDDPERRKRMDRLVKELAEQFTRQQREKPREDTWSSPPMVITFVDFREQGGLAERDGFTTVLITELGSHLTATGRVTLVERALMERLLEELRLGSSELADQQTALRLGKVLAAKLIGTGSVFYLPQETMLTLRLIDTETSQISEQVTRKLDSDSSSVDKELQELSNQLLGTVIRKYPLRGYIVRNSPQDSMMINIGSRQGLVTGTTFDVIEEAEPVVYKGRELSSAPKVVGQVVVGQVEPGRGYVRVVREDRPIRKDDKIQERINETAAR